MAKRSAVRSCIFHVFFISIPNILFCFNCHRFLFVLILFQCFGQEISTRASYISFVRTIQTNIPHTSAKVLTRPYFRSFCYRTVLHVSKRTRLITSVHRTIIWLITGSWQCLHRQMSSVTEPYYRARPVKSMLAYNSYSSRPFSLWWNVDFGEFGEK